MTGADRAAHESALRVLGESAPGDRVVVRAQHLDGARDALGELIARTPDAVTIRTRREDVVVALSDVIAARRVPPPPPPRDRRRPA